MKCDKCGLKAYFNRNRNEWLFMKYKGKVVERGLGPTVTEHYCSRCKGGKK